MLIFWKNELLFSLIFSVAYIFYISLDSDLIIIIYFLLVALGLFWSLFFNFLRWKLKLLIWEIFFNKNIWSYIFLLSSALVHLRKFDMFVLIYIHLKYFLVSLVIFFLWPTGYKEVWCLISKYLGIPQISFCFWF